MKFVFEDLHALRNLIACPDQNSSGIHRCHVSPIADTVIRWSRNRQYFRNFKLPEVSVHEFSQDMEVTNYIIALGVGHSPGIWCGPDSKNNGADPRETSRKHLFSYINPRYLEDLRNNKAWLLLDQSHEGYHTEWLYDWFYTSCRDYGISPKRIVYVTGDLNAHEKNTEYVRNHKVPSIFVLGNPHFETLTEEVKSNFSGLIHVPTFQDHIDYKTVHVDKIKIYNALQKRPRPHRVHLFNELYNRDLIQHGIVSMNFFERSAADNYLTDGLLESDYNRYRDILPVLPPGDDSPDDFASGDSSMYPHKLNEQILLDTWVTVVSESSYIENTCFLSEKTFKTIACSHPFIIYGNKGSLQALRELGYQTFSPFIDESYDNLEAWPRLEAILNALRKIQVIPSGERIHWFSELRSRVEHNTKTLSDYGMKKLRDRFIKMLQYMEN